MNDKLFRIVWNNIYIRRIIISFLNVNPRSSSLLPKYRGKTNKLHQIVFPLNPISSTSPMYYKSLRKKYFNYLEIKNVDKMAIYNKDLLVYKVTKNEVLQFGLNPGMVIFSLFKEDNKGTNDFYNILFKNYSIYFNGNSKTIKLTIDSILEKDCLVAFKRMIDLKQIEISELNGYYINGIGNGSIEIINYLSNQFSFKLNNKQIIEIVKKIKQNSEKQIVMKNKNYKQIHRELGSQTEKTIKTLNYLSSKYQFQQQAQQISQRFHNIFTFTNTHANDTTELPIGPFDANAVTLQFIVDVCNSICLLVELGEIKQPFVFNKLIVNYLDSNPLILSKQSLDKIKLEFKFSKLNCLLKDLSSSDDDIKILVKMAIVFSGNQEQNAMFYKFKFENNYNFYYSVNGYKSFYSLASGNFSIILNSRIKSSDVYMHAKELFYHCINDMKKQKQFVLDFIDFLTKEKDDTHYHNYMDFSSSGDYHITTIGFNHVLFQLLIAHNNFQLIQLFTQLLDKVDPSFIKNIKKEYIFIQSTKVFDLFYNHPKLRSSFNFTLLIEYANNVNGDNNRYNEELNTTFLLNHFKSTYPRDYHQCCSSVYFNSKYEFSLNDYIFNNYQDFQHCYKLQNIFLPSIYILKPPKSIELELSKFILIYNNAIKPTNQEYICPNNVEIFTWILKNHYQDIKPNNKFKNTHINKMMLLKSIYLSNELPIKKNQIFNGGGHEDWIELLSDNDESILKLIIKYSDFDDFKIIFNLFKSISDDNPRYRKLLNFKKLILSHIIKYNNIEILKYIHQTNQSFFSNVKLSTIKLIGGNEQRSSIEAINYLIDIVNFKFDNFELNSFYWR